MNGLAALAVGAYLVAVAWKGNGSRLAEQLGQEKGFIPWAVAFVLLWLLWQSQRARPVAGPLIALALAAFFLQAGAKFWSNFDAVMAKLKGR